MTRKAATYSSVRQAAWRPISAALSGIAVDENGQWLRDQNPYADAAQGEIKSDRNAIPSAKESAFAEYMAAGAFVHCGDAWSYLGRAIDALLKGDVHAAVHLTYYAELRGAVSLLSTEGIYVGDYFSCAVVADGTTLPFSWDGTHKSVWRCLQEWSESPRSSEVIGMALRPGGVELDSWVSSIPGGTAMPVISDLLERMKLDLQSFSGDRERRNAASYTPSRLTPEDLEPSSIRRIVTNVWSLLEPGTRGTFPVLDNLLLKDVLESTFTAVNRVMVNGEPTDEVDWTKWEPWLSVVVPSPLLSSALHLDLLDASNRESSTSILSAAFADEPESPMPHEYIEGMLTRTALLLRMATGSCLHLLDDSGIDRRDIHPWVESLSLGRGLWPAPEPPDDKLDMWADTQRALEALDADSSKDLHGLVRVVIEHLPVFGQAERVVAWSFSS